jgi:hypothetical protein
VLVDDCVKLWELNNDRAFSHCCHKP